MTTMLAGPSKRLLNSLRSTAESCPCLVQKRRIHRKPALHFDATDGIQPFLSEKALNTIGQYQDGLLSRLNDVVKGGPLLISEKSCLRDLTCNSAGTPSESSSVVQTIINTASERSQALAFNYASEALNTSYFLSKLVSLPCPLNRLD